MIDMLCNEVGIVE